MPKKRKRKVDPKKIPAWYTLDLRGPFSFFGELSYSIMNIGRRGQELLDTFAHPTLTIKAPLAQTDSKKVDVGTSVEAIFNLRESAKDQIAIGFIEKEEE